MAGRRSARRRGAALPSRRRSRRPSRLRRLSPSSEGCCPPEPLTARWWAAATPACSIASRRRRSSPSAPTRRPPFAREAGPEAAPSEVERGVGAVVEVMPVEESFRGSRYEAVVLETDGGRTKIRFTSFTEEEAEWVPTNSLRPPPPTPPGGEGRNANAWAAQHWSCGEGRAVGGERERAASRRPSCGSAHSSRCMQTAAGGTCLSARCRRRGSLARWRARVPPLPSLRRR